MSGRPAGSQRRNMPAHSTFFATSQSPPFAEFRFTRRAGHDADRFHSDGQRSRRASSERSGGAIAFHRSTKVEFYLARSRRRRGGRATSSARHSATTASTWRLAAIRTTVDETAKSCLHRRNQDRRRYAGRQALVLQRPESECLHRRRRGRPGFCRRCRLHAALPGCGERPLPLDVFSPERRHLLQFAAGGGRKGVYREDRSGGKQDIRTARWHKERPEHGVQQPLRCQRGVVCRNRRASLGNLPPGRSETAARPPPAATSRLRLARRWCSRARGRQSRPSIEAIKETGRISAGRSGRRLHTCRRRRTLMPRPGGICSEGAHPRLGASSPVVWEGRVF